MNLPKNKYLSSDYFEHNPTWDIKDSPWKAKKVTEILLHTGLSPETICEVGCGAGGVLAELHKSYPDAGLYGFDIAPAVKRYWLQHTDVDIHFKLGDFFELNCKFYDLILLLDVIEHIQDPFEFLNRLRCKAKYYIFHIPLDLSAISVLREQPLLYARHKVGHIHYFTKQLALSIVKDSGFEIIHSRYTKAYAASLQYSFKTRLAGFPRRIAYWINKDWGVRLFGGETLMVLAKDKG
ncbi:MAG: class I SAM-dependent methyltransferase [Deltaproteobacteria bacterium]|nr:MAG: class I SAM-dependent methyltransferase [Deltaproteobacteria bacterium]